MNWRLALSELEAERSHLRLDGEPVILYSLLSPPGQAYANLLRDLYCLDAVMTVSLEWRPWAVEGGPAPDTGRAAALLRTPLLDDGPCAGDGGHGRRHGRLGCGDRVRLARAKPWSSWKLTG